MEQRLQQAIAAAVGGLAARLDALELARSPASASADQGDQRRHSGAGSSSAGAAQRASRSSASSAAAGQARAAAGREQAEQADAVDLAEEPDDAGDDAAGAPAHDAPTPEDEPDAIGQRELVRLITHVGAVRRGTTWCCLLRICAPHMFLSL